VSLIVDEHRQYLADRVRVAAFRAAIGEVVRPGDVVLDLASGTGILGLLACQAGAQRVYSVEEGGMIELARSVCRANGYEDRFKFVKGHSTHVELPEKVDVVLCDQIGHFGFEAGVLEFFNDARARFLKPEGRLIPQRVDMFLAPVQSPEMWGQVEFWNESPAGFDFRAARTWAANTGYPTKLASDQLLGEPARLCAMDLTRAAPASFGGELGIQVGRAGTLHGLGGWFLAQLSPRVVMSNSPLIPEPIERRNVFFPVDHPVAVVPGDGVRIRMHIIPNDSVVTWKVEVRTEHPAGTSETSNGLKARFAHSTLQGMLLCKEDLERTRPGFVPKLSLWGEARRSILELCDGRRPLAEIEEEVYRRHNHLFRDPGEAAAYVAEVIPRYAL
jgi:SAM-dependent methyltransferase